MAAGCVTPPGQAAAAPADKDETGQMDDMRQISEALDKLASFQDLRAGGAGDMACGEWLEQYLGSQGFATRRQYFETPFFEADTAHLRAGAVQASVFPQGIVVPTGPEGVSGPLRIWHTPGDVEDPAGAIVLMVLPYARHSQLANARLKAAIRPLSEGGAAAIVLVTTGPTGERIALNAAPDGPAWPQPMAVIGPRDAEAFYALAGKTATLVTDGTGGKRQAFNLVGNIDRNGPAIVVSTPRSGWGPCMGERGPGIAILYALAKWLPSAFPDRSLTLVVNSGHEYDNLGSQRFLAEAAPSPDTTGLWFHLGAGFAARDWHEMGGRLLPLKSADAQRFLIAGEEFLPTLRESFAGLPGLEVPYPARAGSAGELGEILSAGYPAAIGMLGAHRFHHVADDTAEKTGPELVLPVLQAVRSTLLRLA